MPISGQQAVERLRKFVGQGVYGLGKGGKNPLAATPFEIVQGAGTTTLLECDCIGAVLWAYQCGRHLSSFPEYDGDINVDSAMMDAGIIKGDHSAKKFFREVLPGDYQIGDILMFPSVRAHEVEDSTLPPTTRIRIGHTGLISGFSTDHTVPTILDLKVIECSGFLPAIKEGQDKNFHANSNRTAVGWKGRSHFNPNWATRVVRFIRYESKS